MTRGAITEKAIEAYLVKRVKEVGGKAYKFNSMSNRGVSDRIVLFPNGKLYFVELKTAKGVQSPLQKLFEKEVTELGQEYVLLNSRYTIDEFIKGALHD